MNKADVLIIGGGVIGSAAAYELSKNSVSVALLERETIGAGASGMSAAALEAQLDAPESGPFSDLLIASRALFSDLSQELSFQGLDIGFEACGILQVSASPEETARLKARMAWQAKHGWNVEWLDEPMIAKRCPRLRGYKEGLLYAGDGQVIANRLTSALAEAARRKGCRLEEHCEARTLRPAAGGVRVETAKGDWESGKVILAAGPWADQLLAPLGAALHLEPVRGQLLLLEMPERLLPFPVYAPRGYLMPKADGTMIIGSTRERVGFTTATTESAVQALKKFALAAVPELAHCKYLGAVAGLRPAGLPDDIPAIGPLPGLESVLVAAGHFKNGMLLAPITAQLLAAHILHKKAPVSPEPFLPSRLVKNSVVR